MKSQPRVVVITTRWRFLWGNRVQASSFGKKRIKAKMALDFTKGAPMDSHQRKCIHKAFYLSMSWESSKVLPLIQGSKVGGGGDPEVEKKRDVRNDEEREGSFKFWQFLVCVIVLWSFKVVWIPSGPINPCALKIVFEIGHWHGFKVRWLALRIWNL